MIDRNALRSVLVGERDSLDSVSAIAEWIDTKIAAAVLDDRESRIADLKEFVWRVNDIAEMLSSTHSYNLAGSTPVDNLKELSRRITALLNSDFARGEK